MKVALKNLHLDMTSNDFVYVRIDKGMYGLKQAAILAYKQLCTRLEQAGYKPIIGSAGMFKHETRKTKFCLCVDEFGMKYSGLSVGWVFCHSTIEKNVTIRYVLKS